MKLRIIPLFLLALLSACSKGQKDTATSATNAQPAVEVPDFNADSAYSYVNRQVSFGSRVPNTEAHRLCAAYLAGELRRHGATVTEQTTEVSAYDGTNLHITNLIGSYAPENPIRILLCAHWDSRPWADADPDEKNHRKPILGANDGASGVGVLLELARMIHQKAPRVGVDLILFDAEDYGLPQWEDRSSDPNAGESTWCLGSQYWATHPHVENYMPRYGILLDMVGGEKATFYKEGYSMDFAAAIVEKVWSQAAAAGYAEYFIDGHSGYVTDDHLFVNRLAHIPCIDIIPADLQNGGFSPVWHTLKDDMSAISAATLKAVGQTVAAVIYHEQ